MNKFTYENQGTHTYLVYTVGDDILDNMSVGMLTGNHIDGFLPTTVTQLDSQKYVKYDISGKLATKEFLTGAVTRNRLLGVFRGVVRALFSAEEYMLDYGSVILDLEYMFSDVSTAETELICVPVISTERAPVQPAAFFKEIISNIQCDQTENCDYFAKIFNYLNGHAVFSLEEFRELLDTLSKGGSGVTASASGASRTTATSHTSAPAPARTKPQNTVTSASSSNAARTNPPAKSGSSSAPKSTTATSKTAPEPEGPEISFMYLMQHYNKENAALYKAQQEAKKQKKEAGDAGASAKKPAKKQGGSTNFGFAIPGQESITPSVDTSSEADTHTSGTTSTHSSAPAQGTGATSHSTAGAHMNFGDTVVVSGGIDNGTVVIGTGATQEKVPHLIRIKTREKFSLAKPFVRIGRERKFVDFCIADNPAVSSCHANIYNRGGVCAISDTNSTNHTYVNDVMVKAGSEMVLSDGDRVCLGDEEFEFKLC